jgi:phage terminase small subunit
MPTPDSPEQPKPKALSGKQKAFVEAYVGEARFNASKAVILAGYETKNPNDLGYQLRNTPHIRARIDELLEANTLSPGEVLRELTDVGMRELHEFVTITRFDADGNPIAAKMDATAKIKSLELVGKAHGIFTEKIHHSGEVSVPITTIRVTLDPDLVEGES